MEGYGKEIEKFDRNLGVLLEELREDDLLILTADHGNAPAYSGTDHTREYVPFLAYSKTMKEGGPLENEDTFSVIGASVADNFDVKMPEGTIGHSILEKLCEIRNDSYWIAVAHSGDCLLLRQNPDRNK